MTENKVVAILRCLFFPPKCCACSDFLQEHILDTEQRALCERCRKKWEYAKLSSCTRCGEELSKCRCIPLPLKRAGASAMLKMVPYDKEENTVAKRSILFMKRKNSRAVFAFFSGQMSGLLREYLNETYTQEKDVLVTYLPRGRRNRRRSGIDQSELLAKGVAAQSGCEFASLLLRGRRGGKEQKQLDRSARVKNVKDAFRLSMADFSDVDRRYRCLVLVDDVVTTGASLAECVRLLRTRFHGRIVCLCLGKTEELRG